MDKYKRMSVWIVLLGLCLTCSGCSLLTAPFQLLGQVIGGTFNFMGQVLQTASGLPTPPPWVFF